MRIISESIEQLIKVKERTDLIPTVIDKIFSICKEDSTFSISSDISDIDNKLKSLEAKLYKQKKLLEKANGMEITILSKLKLLEDDSYGIKVRVLESLGSEL